MVIRLHFVVFQDDDGTHPAALQADVEDQFAQLNQSFRPYGIQFTKDTTSFVSCTRFKNFCVPGTSACGTVLPTCLMCGDECRVECSSEEEVMKNLYAVDPAHGINIFVVADYIGLGYFPWCSGATGYQGGVVIGAQNVGGTCIEGPCNVLTHEIGHNLGLWHTFHGVDEVVTCSTCYEPATCNGSAANTQCDTVGDFCSDTPSTKTLTTCPTVGSGVDCLGTPFPPPDATNYMDYVGDSCWDHFTAQQARRMYCWNCSAAGGWIDSPDCNINGRPDVCDLAEGTSEDCNGNGVPDECESPTTIGACCGITCTVEQQICCNAAGGAFIGAGTTCDCNGDGVPDACETEGLHPCCLQSPVSCVLWTAECCSAVGGQYFPTKKKCTAVNCTAMAPLPGP
jgi:hypothetical protein